MLLVCVVTNYSLKMFTLLLLCHLGLLPCCWFGLLFLPLSFTFLSDNIMFLWFYHSKHDGELSLSVWIPLLDISFIYFSAIQVSLYQRSPTFFSQITTPLLLIHWLKYNQFSTLSYVCGNKKNFNELLVFINDLTRFDKSEFSMQFHKLFYF